MVNKIDINIDNHFNSRNILTQERGPTEGFAK